MVTTTTKTDTYIEKVGRRKTSSARVRITPSSKSDIIVNGQKLHEYFLTEEMQAIVKTPLNYSGDQKFTISVQVYGGGIHSQSEAVSLGISRALVAYNKETRQVLKQEGLLTRDARAKERRKFGLKKARRAPQWSKR